MKTQAHRNSQEHTKCRCTGKCSTCTCRSSKENRPKKKSARTPALLLFVAVVLGTVTDPGVAEGIGKPGLLIIAHGSPSAQWNEPVLGQERKVRELLGPNNPFAKTKVAFMEFAEPNVADGVADLEETGCNRIVAVPLLVAPSSHSHWDVPALLGLYSDPEIEESLREEGLRVLRSKVPITLTTTLAHSNVIEEVMLKRARQLSTDSDNEAVVVLAHGSAAIPPAWENLMKRTVTYICGQTGISYGDWVCVGVGQEYHHAAAAIRTAAEHRKRVIVVGAYLSLGPQRMHNRWLSRFKQQEASMHGFENPLEGIDVKLAEQGLLPDEMVAQWIAATARNEIERHR
jgi:sirohydrochlorin ferrochelatase